MGVSLFFLLFALSYFLVFSQVTAKPEKIKQVLRDSGVYQKIPAVLYDSSVDSTRAAEPASTIPLKNPAVRQAVIDTFDAGFVQRNAETALDGAYAWLEGKTSEPKFKIDLKDAKDRFAKSLSKQTGERLEGLPPCTAEQLRKVRDIDPFDLPCLPPGTDIAALKKEVLESAASSDDLLEETVFTPASFKDENEKPLFDSYPGVPEGFQLFKRLPYILAVICAVIGAGIIFASTTKREGAKRLAKLLLVAGIFVSLAPIAINRIAGAILSNAPGDAVAAELVAPIIEELNQATSKVYFTTGAVYVLLAAGAYLIYRKTAPKAVATERKN